MTTFQPKLLLPTHLLAHEWTIPPADLRREVERRRLGRVRVVEGFGDSVVVA